MPSRSRPPDRRDVSETRRSDQSTDPGAFIGSEPEREAETIPGGVDRQDQRMSASNSRPGVDGEPEERDTSSVVDSEVGSATLKESAETEDAADVDGVLEVGDR